MFHADTQIGRSIARRVEVIAVDDSGPIQMVTVQGLDGEYFKLPLRGQGFGLSTVPPKGSIGYLFMANGRPDQAFLFGLEHPDKRPRDRKDGESVMYGGNGQTVEMRENGDIEIRSPNGIVHLNPE